MSRLKKLMLLFMVLLFAGTDGFVEAADKHIVAKVGDVDITFFELQRETQRIMPFNKSFHGSVSKERLMEIRKIALGRLIDQAHKVRYAAQENISVPDSDVNDRIAMVKAKIGGDEGLKKALGKESLEQFRAAVYRLLVSKKAEEVTVDKKAEVSEAELLKFYQENTYMYQQPKQYRASHILVKVNPSLVGEEREKLVQKAHDLAERAKAGENFHNLAYYNSDEDTKFVGGDVGYFQSGQTVKEFEDAIRDLDLGDIVGPVETISGFHIIQLTGIKDPRLLDYEEVRPQIKETIEEKTRQRLYDEWLNGLKKQVDADILYPELKS